MVYWARKLKDRVIKNHQIHRDNRVTESRKILITMALLVAPLIDSACNAGELGLILGSERSPGEGSSNPLQYSCLKHPMNSMKRQKDRTLKDELPRLVIMG